jgi:hypothetical protein
MPSPRLCRRSIWAEQYSVAGQLDFLNNLFADAHLNLLIIVNTPDYLGEMWWANINKLYLFGGINARPHN